MGAREYKKFPKSISIHFNCSFMQVKQQTNNTIAKSIVAIILQHLIYVCTSVYEQVYTTVFKWELISGRIFQLSAAKAIEEKLT